MIDTWMKSADKALLVSVQNTFANTIGVSAGIDDAEMFYLCVRDVQSAAGTTAFGADGSTVSTTSTAIPPVNLLRFGARGNGGTPLSGHIRRFRYWNRDLPNAELQRITT